MKSISHYPKRRLSFAVSTLLLCPLGKRVMATEEAISYPLTISTSAYKPQKRKQIDKNKQRALALSDKKPKPLSNSEIQKEVNGMKRMSKSQKDNFLRARMPDFTY